MRDSSKDVKVVTSIAAASRTADNTPVAVDRAGYEGVTYIISVGVGGITFDDTNKAEFKLTHSDDDVTYTAVTDADVVITLPDGTAGTVDTGGIVLSLVVAHAAATVTKVGYIGGKQHTKLLDDRSGTHGTGTPVSAIAVLSHGRLRPAA